MRLIDADEIVYESIDLSDTEEYFAKYGTGILAVRKEDIDEMPAEPHWIPVTERLPEVSGRYLVTRGLNVCGAMWNRVYLLNYSDLMGLKSERIWWDGNVGKSDFERIDDVLTWMPLPEPFKEVLVSSGVRCAELCSLRISDVDLHTKTVLVKCGKGGKGRKTFISDLAAAHLAKYLSERKDDRPELFLSNYKKGYTTKGVEHQLNGIAKRAGVENVHPHRFRRTFATNLYRRGMDVHEIQRLMGHTNVNTTLEYIYADENHLATAYQKYAA